jgi:hypothetical protein
MQQGLTPTTPREGHFAAHEVAFSDALVDDLQLAWDEARLGPVEWGARAQLPFVDLAGEEAREGDGPVPPLR